MHVCIYTACTSKTHACTWQADLMQLFAPFGQAAARRTRLGPSCPRLAGHLLTCGMGTQVRGGRRDRDQDLLGPRRSPQSKKKEININTE